MSRIENGRLVGILLTASLLVAAPIAGVERTELQRAFNFGGAVPQGLPTGWGGGVPETIGVDTTFVHDRTLESFSLHLNRQPDSAQSFSSITCSIPADFAGSTLTFRGWLRTADAEKHAGLWLRQDATAGMVGFDNMSGRGPVGTTDWTQYSIEMPLSGEANQIVFGVLLVGSGQVWAGGLEFLVDGQPVWEAPARPVALTVLDTDTEFAAGSGLAIDALDRDQAANVALLGRVWGFLKYHHPAVIAGERHWDFELFRILPAVLAAPDRPAALAAIAAWVDLLGPVAPCTDCALKPVDVHFDADLDWLADVDLLGNGLSAALLQIRRNRVECDGQFYVSFNSGAGNAGFDHEPDYADLPQVDAGYRLLALFRFWNCVEYWFPYRDVIGTSWPVVLAEFVPRLVAAADPADYRQEMIGLIARVNDTHANLWNGLADRPPRGRFVVPVEVRFIEGQAVVTGLVPDLYTGDIPLEVGDVIVAVDGEPVGSLVELWAPFYAASNEPTRLREIARSLTVGSAPVCGLSIERDGRTLDVTALRLARDTVSQHYRWRHTLPGPALRLLSPELAYLNMSAVAGDSVDSYLARAAGTRGWIIDLRTYPSDFLVFALGTHLVSAPTPFVSFTVGDAANPGTFVFRSGQSLDPAAPRYDGRIVILVDEATQSSAEYTAMAFRAAPGAVVIGSTTAGADGNVSRLPLPGGLSTMISGLGIFYPDRAPTQRLGIVPDIRVLPTRAGILAGRDEVLERAVAEILGRVPESEEMAQMIK